MHTKDLPMFDGTTLSYYSFKLLKDIKYKYDSITLMIEDKDFIEQNYITYEIYFFAVAELIQKNMIYINKLDVFITLFNSYIHNIFNYFSPGNDEYEALNIILTIKGEWRLACHEKIS